MYRLKKDVNRNVQEQEASREAVSRKHEVELDIQVLEERIAPVFLSEGINMNRSETLVGEQRASEDVELDIQVLEERIAPSRVISHFLVSGDADDRPTEEVAFY